MYKIAISGKANSGKDTVAKMFSDIKITPDVGFNTAKIKVALADPIKDIIRIMFPRTKRSTLYGPSKNRSEKIPGAFLNNEQLTYRKLLQNLGTEVGRGYKESIWLDVLDYKAEKAEKKWTSLFIVTDVRFRNEFDHLKNKGFTMIRVVRDSQLSLNHSSEIEQETIADSEFDIIIENNSTKDDLNKKIIDIWNEIIK